MPEAAHEDGIYEGPTSQLPVRRSQGSKGSAVLDANVRLDARVLERAGPALRRLLVGRERDRPQRIISRQVHAPILPRDANHLWVGHPRPGRALECERLRASLAL